MSVNKLFVEGRLVADPELKELSGTTIATFDVAVQEGKNDANFFPVVCFNGWAHALVQNAKKGDPVFIVGHLRQERWKDKESGENRSRVKIVAEQVKELRIRPKREKPAKSR